MWSGAIGDSDSGPIGRGRIPARRLTVHGENGERLEVVNGAADPSHTARLTVLRDIRVHRFERCPICRTPEPTSTEHVPPGALGGQVRTWTCEPCTNGLGSRVEAELIDWRDDALRHARTVSEEVLGARKLPRLLRRRTPDGRFVLMVDGPLHPDVKLMLQGQDFALQFTPPDPNRYKLAALKHAYWLHVWT